MSKLTKHKNIFSVESISFRATSEIVMPMKIL